VGTALGLALGLIAAVVVFVLLAMDAGRYRWATELIGRFLDEVIDSIVALARRVRALVGRT
jgi:hypothetical protein